MTPRGLAEAIDDFAQRQEVAAVSLDGPQGWRNPSAAESQGVGRACERSSSTPGKTGCFGTTFPANQVGWISFSIAVFDHLLSLEHVRLANDAQAGHLVRRPPGEYYVLECFPTVTWRTSELMPLRAKKKHPDTSPFADALAARWHLRGLELAVGHDDLQAVVAGLVAASLSGWGTPIAHGTPASTWSNGAYTAHHRIEGLIWDARPPAIRATAHLDRSAPSAPARQPTRRRGHSPPKSRARRLGSATVSAYDFERAKPFIIAIPRGRWSRYKDVAAAAGNPDAAEALTLRPTQEQALVEPAVRDGLPMFERRGHHSTATARGVKQQPKRGVDPGGRRARPLTAHCRMPASHLSPVGVAPMAPPLFEGGGAKGEPWRRAAPVGQDARYS